MSHLADESLGEFLVLLRKAAGLSQNQLSQRAGMSRPVLSKLEKGKHHTPATRGLVRRYMEALGYPEEDIRQWMPYYEDVCPHCWTWLGSPMPVTDFERSYRLLRLVLEHDASDVELPTRVGNGVSFFDLVRSIALLCRVAAGRARLEQPQPPVGHGLYLDGYFELFNCFVDEGGQLRDAPMNVLSGQVAKAIKFLEEAPASLYRLERELGLRSCDGQEGLDEWLEQLHPSRRVQWISQWIKPGEMPDILKEEKN
jgi:transcriptional regulator with XRE-family HTH domain